MKRIIALVLALCAVLGFAGCSKKKLAESKPVNAEKTEVKKTEEAFGYPEIKNPLTWEKINAIPVAKGDMTTDQLRQICVDFMRLQLSFEWTPDHDHDYKIETEMHNNKPMSFKKGEIYAGIPYRAGSNVGQSGNLYTIMELYDPETGILSSEGLSTDRLTSLISNHCSSSCYWAWSRVVNTMYGTADDFSKAGLSNANMTKERGFLPVGPYTYSGVDSWSDGDGTRAVAEANGEQVMYQSYAATGLADGLIQLYPKGTSRANHVMMVCAEPVVTRLPNGKIDGENSYLTIFEQTSSPTELRVENGKTVMMEGRVDKTVTFKSLFESSYLPFTFAEFIGDDPVEDRTLAMVSKNNAEILDLKALRNAVLTSNYAISCVSVTATAPDGKVVYTRNAHPAKTGTFSYDLYLAVSPTPIDLEKDGNALKISVQLGNGEQIVLYENGQFPPLV